MLGRKDEADHHVARRKRTDTDPPSPVYSMEEELEKARTEPGEVVEEDLGDE